MNPAAKLVMSGF